jgi:hypothetical protein
MPLTIALTVLEQLILPGRLVFKIDDLRFAAHITEL